MQHLEGRFRDAHDADIYYQAWLPEADPRAVLLIIHGLGEHSGRYTNVVNHFVPLGYAVYGFDFVGHGRSGGRREYVDSIQDLIDILAAFHALVKGWQPGLPIYLLAHSMGALLASYYLLDQSDGLAGAVMSAPTVVVGDHVTPATIAAGKILAVVAPRAGILPLDAGMVSRDPAVVSAYAHDPLVFHAKTSARLASELLKAMQRVAAEAGKITLPVIILQGGDDKIVKSIGAQVLYDKVGSADKTVKIYPGLYHEIYNEPERAVVLADVENWLAARL
ncbi:MAG: alpha/beta hydrolase [Anaerolineae bacterium]